jgi:serine/threonine-protein kinase
MNEQHQIARFVVRQGLLTLPEAEQALEECRGVALLDWLQRRGWLTPDQAAGVDALRRLAVVPGPAHAQETEDEPGRPAAAARADTPRPAALDATSSSDPLRALFGLPADSRERRGRFVLEEETPRGKGGMGQVWLAHDHGLGRRVALKEMRPELADQEEARRRFLLEAQVTSQLQHPGIVPVYEVLDSGQGPFYTMRFVEGRTLAQAVADYHRQPTPAALHDLLAVFVQVCQTLAYAHSRGVVHRDLKPANVVVGSFGEVVLLDWGLALVLASRGGERPEAGGAVWVDDPVLSKAAGGTPGYMAPEQARGEIDAIDERADVFGLGAILCEILTGKPPFGGAGPAAFLQSQRADLAEALGRLDGCAADAELVALAKACLAARPEDRPRDAAAVARAATAYQAGVAARLRQAELAQAEARARAAEEAKRRRLALAAVAAVVLGLALAGGGWWWRQAERAARQVQLARDVSAALSRAAELRVRAAQPGGAASIAQAREQAQRALALAETGLTDPVLWQQVRQLQGELDEQEKDRQFLAALDAARLAQTEDAPQNGKIAWERAVPRFREAFRAYGLPAGQVEPDEAAARLRARPAAVQEAAAAALEEWADLVDDPDLDLDEPHRGWLEAVAVATAPADGWARRSRAAQAEKDRARRRAALLELARQADPDRVPAAALAALAKRLGLARCEADAARLLERAQRTHRADFWINELLGVALSATRPSEPAEAAPYLMAAVALRPDCPEALNVLGVLRYSAGDLDDAEALFRKAAAVAPSCASAHSNLGLVLEARGETDEALACFRRAVAVDPTYAAAQANLGMALRSKGRLDEAVACGRRAVALAPKLAAVHTHLGLTLQARGELDEAVACYRRAVALDPRSADAHTWLGAVLRDQGDLGEAVACLRQAVALNPKNANAYSYLGLTLQDRGEPEEAVACCRRAIALDPKSDLAHFNLGRVLFVQGRLDEAAACFGRAAALNPQHAVAHHNLGQALIKLGRFAEAHAALARALELFPAKDPLRAVAARQLPACARLAELEGKLPRLLRGEGQAATAREGLELALICRQKRLHAGATRLAAAAFAAEPGLADDLSQGSRYDLACSAALAAAGQGADADKLAATDRQALRRQALTWLRAELAARSSQVKSFWATQRQQALAALLAWRTDPDLATLRDREALARLAAPEREAWQGLWDDLERLLATLPEGQWQLGELHAARREWAAAARCYGQVVKLRPTDAGQTDEGHLWFEYAAVLLLSGDRDGYRKACAHMLERCGQTRGVRPYHAARACTLAPDSVGDAARPGRLADAELKEHSREFWSLTEQAALLHRGGDSAAAVPLLKQSLEADPRPGTAVVTWLWLALACEKLGQPAEARQWREKAGRWLDSHREGMPPDAEKTLGLHLHNWLEAHVLRAEAIPE